MLIHLMLEMIHQNAVRDELSGSAKMKESILVRILLKEGLHPRPCNCLLYTSTYLSLDGENIIATKEDKSVSRFPLHNIEGIVGFGFTGASPALMGKCADMGISLTFMTMHGRFLARVVGEERGNVLLRKEQFRISESSDKRLAYAKNMITAKLINSRNILLLSLIHI